MANFPSTLQNFLPHLHKHGIELGNDDNCCCCCLIKSNHHHHNNQRFKYKGERVHTWVKESVSQSVRSQIVCSSKSKVAVAAAANEIVCAIAVEATVPSAARGNGCARQRRRPQTCKTATDLIVKVDYQTTTRQTNCKHDDMTARERKRLNQCSSSSSSNWSDCAVIRAQLMIQQQQQQL